MMMPVSRSVLLMFALTALLTSCTPPNTKLLSVWRDEAYRDHPRKVLVIGVLRTLENRKIFEDEMVSQIKEKGTDAAASHAVNPELEGIDRAAVIAMMNAAGADAVMITRVVDRRTAMAQMPSLNSIGYVGGLRGDRSGTFVQDEYTATQTGVYDLKTEKLVWSVSSETWMIDKDAQLVRAFGKFLIGHLVRDKVLAEKPAR